MIIQDRRVDFYLNTIWAIAKSSCVSEYMIGYTASQLWKRYSGYRSLGYNHIVILEDKMTRVDALWLEERLQEEIKLADKREQHYRKYHPDKRDGRYFRSAGQATSNPNKPIHSVYMAWSE